METIVLAMLCAFVLSAFFCVVIYLNDERKKKNKALKQLELLLDEFDKEAS